MSSLTKHLTTPSPHGHLPFDSRCPLCCEERLHGTIPDTPIVPSRVKASLATALVAISAAATPTASIAQEADQETEGIELPNSGRGGESDPGDEAQVPGDESVPGPGAPGGDENDDAEGPPVGSEPEVGRQPEPPAGPEETIPGSKEQPGPRTQEAPAAESDPSPDPNASKPDRATSRDDGKKDDAASDRTGHKPEPSQRPASDSRGAGAPEEGQPTPPLQRSTTPVAPATADPQPTLTSARADENIREHVVRPGESLWSIAADFAGRDATPARIARIVNRLWDLNAGRIGTGNPDLVMAGTKLRLP